MQYKGELMCQRSNVHTAEIEAKEKPVRDGRQGENTKESEIVKAAEVHTRQKKSSRQKSLDTDRMEHQKEMFIRLAILEAAKAKTGTNGYNEEIEELKRLVL